MQQAGLIMHQERLSLINVWNLNRDQFPSLLPGEGGRERSALLSVILPTNICSLT
jgi:hypothetical protein